MRDGVYHQYARIMEEHWWTRNRRHLVDRLLARIGVVADGTRKVLEIGAGAGTEFSYLSRFGPVTAVELSPVGAAYCRKQGYEEVLEANLNDYRPAPGVYDVVVDFNVLYHKWVEDPQRVLSQLREGLRPDGILVSSEPAFDILRREHDQVGEGTRRWGRRDIKELVTSAGFDLVSLTPYCFFLAPAVLGIKLVERLRSSHTEAAEIRELDPVSPALESGIDTLMKVERAVGTVLPLPWGTTWVLVARQR